MKISRKKISKRVIGMGLALFIAGITQAYAQMNMGIGLSLEGGSNPKGTINLVMDPGESREIVAVIKNNATKAQIVQLQARDAAITEDGYFALKGPGLPKTGVGKWLESKGDGDSTAVKVEAGAQSEETFIIRVPLDATPGDYGGGILMSKSDQAVEEVLEVTEDTTNGKELQSGTVIEVNVGTRIYLTVKGEQKMELAWNQYNHTKNEAKQHQFEYQFSNVGNVTIDATGELKLKNIFGPAQTEEVRLGTLPPGGESKPIVTWENPPYIGWIEATTTINYERSQGYGGGGEVVNHSEPMIKSVSFFILPIRDLMISLAVSVLVFCLLYMKRRKEKLMLKHFEAVVLSRDESITSLAKRYNIHWKLLARLNNIKQPYFVIAGQSILVPPTPGQNSAENKVVSPMTTNQSTGEAPLFPDLKS